MLKIFRFLSSISHILSVSKKISEFLIGKLLKMEINLFILKSFCLFNDLFSMISKILKIFLIHFQGFIKLYHHSSNIIAHTLSLFLTQERDKI
jgi:hypothetical protein